MYVLLGDVEKRIEVLERARQEKGKLKFSFPTANSSITPPSFDKESQNGVKEEEQERNITLDITVQNANTTMGQRIYVVGSLEALGNWDTSKAVPLNTSMFVCLFLRIDDFHWCGTYALL